ncbi:NAD(P)/FAD-dependent oxidoreductase [Trinickia dinghuensis]|uniref:FAD-binding oxidoreductase n=1 Tax=Trinickia dinghuensis TaxID=2291023 RepID=A0A3D8JXQ8_9BURK|nr:FAD-binding oxidoreductase [Trinickia dinghuensis]RDU97405.1 FAD-binding oxidoreductase [Trinickia dinghuensis]
MSTAKGSGAHIIVVGAGIVGASAAYFLTQAGHAVTVIDADTPMAGASGASDGAVSVGSKKPGFLMQVAQRARDLYVELQRDGVLSGLFYSRPTYLFARNALEAEVLSLHATDLVDAGVRVDRLSTDELAHRIPGLSRSIVSAVSVPDDGHALGYQVVERMLRLAAPRIIRHAAVRSVRIEHGRAIGVETDAGFMGADAVLIAAGLGSKALLGLGEILRPRKGQIVITDRAADNQAAFDGQLMSASYLAAKRDVSASKRDPISLVIDPLLTGQFLIGGTREDGLGDGETTINYVSGMLRQAVDIYPSLEQRRVIRTFAGVRTATVDGIPIVGAHPHHAALTIATGFEGDGICLGPLMGRLAAEIVMGKPCSLDIGISPLSPSRFSAAVGLAQPSPTAQQR